MSYSLSVPATPRSQVGDAVHDAVGKHLDDITASGNVAQPVAEVTDHLEAIALAVQVLSEAIGRPDDPISVTISGHANEGHAPAAGWSNEAMSISLSVTDVPRPTD